MSARPSTTGQSPEAVNPSISPETISTEAIRSQLEKILASPGFVHSDRILEADCPDRRTSAKDRGIPDPIYRRHRHRSKETSPVLTEAPPSGETSHNSLEAA